MFPFNYWGVSHDRCSFHRADDMENDKVIGNYRLVAVLTLIDPTPICPDEDRPGMFLSSDYLRTEPG